MTTCWDFARGHCKALCEPFCKKFYGEPMSQPAELRIPPPERPRTHSHVQTVPENHILLIFGSDDHAELFGSWLDEEGWAAFQEWASL